MKQTSPIHTATLIVGALCVMASPARGEGSAQAEAKHDISPALRDIPPSTLLSAAAFVRREHRVRRLPRRPPKTRAAGAALPAASEQAIAAAPLKATKATTFEGLGDGTIQVSSEPPDTNGSVGTTQYVEWVNTAFAVFEKATGKIVFGPADGNTLWRGFGGNCETFNDGDPIVLYDKLANRWFLTQFAVSGRPFSQCIAVSTTPDATGPYARYEFQFDDFNDYGKFGVWPDAYYGAFNMFKGTSFVGARACAFERSQMLAGEAARMQCFDVAGTGGLLPSDLDGSTPPPAGAPNYLAAFADDQLNLWKFHVDWASPAASTLNGPQAVPTAPFDVACDSCVVQPSPGTTLDTLSDRLMFRLAYRRFPDHESLVVNHTVATKKAAGVRWYEVRDPGGAPAIHQQGTYAPSSLFRWMGSLAMDKMGNMAMAYSVSGASVFPSIRYTGRGVGDPRNKMASEQALVIGKGAQKSPDRWGDYSSMSVDPTDDCTFWFTTQYLKDTGTFNWHTAVASIRFQACP